MIGISKPFIFGLHTSVEESALLATEEAFVLTGDNTGNLAYHFAIDRQLGSGLSTLPWHASNEEIDGMQGTAVMPLANQLGVHCDMGEYVNKFARLRSPIIGIGLGVQSSSVKSEVADVEIPQGTLDWVRAIQNHAPSAAPNISLRGEFTRQVLERHGLANKTIVLGCPTLFISPNRYLGQSIAKRYMTGVERIGVAAGQRHWMHLQHIESSLAQMARTTGGSYLCQSDIEMVHLGRREARLLEATVRDSCRNYIAPDMSDAEFIRWCDLRAVSYFSAAAWMEDLKKHDFVIGARIHGVMLALQVGVPGLCIAHDSRTVELCQVMRVPYILANDVSEGIKRDDIMRLFNFDPDEFDRNRRELARSYMLFLEGNHLSPAKYLVDLSAPPSVESEKAT